MIGLCMTYPYILVFLNRWNHRKRRFRSCPCILDGVRNKRQLISTVLKIRVYAAVILYVEPFVPLTAISTNESTQTINRVCDTEFYVDDLDGFIV